MSNLENPALHKIELRALEQKDIQTLRLVKEIRTLREKYGTQRSEHVRQKTVAEEFRQSELRNMFAKAVGAVRRAVPSLPPLAIDKDTLSVSLYQSQLEGPPL